MRIIAVTFVVLATAMAGCTSDSEGMAEYAVLKGDVSSFVYLKIPEEAKEQFPNNPGQVIVEDFPLPGLTAMYASFLAHSNATDNPAIVSQVMRFNNETNAQVNIESMGACSEDSFILDGGTTIAMVIITMSSDDANYEFTWQQAHDGFHKVLARTGSVDYCESEGMDH